MLALLTQNPLHASQAQLDMGNDSGDDDMGNDSGDDDEDLGAIKGIDDGVGHACNEHARCLPRDAQGPSQVQRTRPPPAHIAP